jgi:hypothetical protein
LNISRPAEAYRAADLEECCNMVCTSRKWRSNVCVVRIAEVPMASLTRRAASVRLYFSKIE